MSTDTPAAAPTAEREAMRKAAERLRDAYNAATAGKWRKGLTTHHTVTDLPTAPNYKIGEFHHADDAHFCDVAHEVAPMLFRAALSAPVAAQPAASGVGALWVRKAKKLADDVEQRAVSFGGSSDSYAEEADRKLAAARDALRTHLSTALTGAAKDVK